MPLSVAVIPDGGIGDFVQKHKGICMMQNISGIYKWQSLEPSAEKTKLDRVALLMTDPPHAYLNS